MYIYTVRRTYQRSVRKSDHAHQVETNREAFATKRKELRNAIRKAQNKSWEDLCRAVETDPWGIPYIVITKHIGRRRPGAEARGKEDVVADHLFPELLTIAWYQEPQPVDHADGTIDLEFTLDELRTAAIRLSTGKAPGLDYIPNEVLRRVIIKKSRTLLGTYNVCIRQQAFLLRWKIARLVLLYKGAGKSIDEPSSYISLCLIDAAGKLLERLFLNRLDDHLSKTGMRAENQYGFRRGRSNKCAIEQLIEVATGDVRGAVQHRDLCVVVSLDVRNAFNTAPWRRIDEVVRKCRVPAY